LTILLLCLLLSFCFIWEDISNTSDSVSSAIHTPQISSKHIQLPLSCKVFGSPNEILSLVFDMYSKLAKKTHLSTSYIYLSIEGLRMTLQPSAHLDQQDFSLVKYIYCSTEFFKNIWSRWFPWWNTHQKALQEANSNFLWRDQFWQLPSTHSRKFGVPHKALADFASYWVHWSKSFYQLKTATEFKNLVVGGFCCLGAALFFIFSMFILIISSLVTSFIVSGFPLAGFDSAVLTGEEWQ